MTWSSSTRFLLLSTLLTIPSPAAAKKGYGADCPSGWSECDSELCLQLGGTSFCTQECDDSKPCPGGDRCMAMSINRPGASVPRVCVPASVRGKKLRPDKPDAKPEKTDKSKPEKAAEKVLPPGGPAKCTIRSIHGVQAKSATEKAGGIDKRLAQLKGQLSKPPFSVYNSLQLLEVKVLEVPQTKTAELTLPTGKLLKLTFQERLLGRKDTIRLRMHLSITPPKEKRFLRGTLFTIPNGGTLLVAGDKHKGGTLVVGITCKGP